MKIVQSPYHYLPNTIATAYKQRVDQIFYPSPSIKGLEALDLEISTIFPAVLE